eukprot:TRINITY_DN1169_c0_g1_i1.p1 TRINITY_DN1169_c0_g1~~TRINITY_DN1169_c0_g1_i1.p1  ORF type:complete len:196 (-),score=8.91 TRINITY_DN1169_c0_g1_i1:230-766(-)
MILRISCCQTHICKVRQLGEMPTLNIVTNVPGDKVSNSDTIKALSSTMSSVIGKPEQYVMISLRCDVSMCFAGSEEACAYAELISIGAIGGDKNKTISASLAQVLEEKLKVPRNRFYLKFYDVARADFGYNGTTFGRFRFQKQQAMKQSMVFANQFTQMIRLMIQDEELLTQLRSDGV